MAKYDQGGGCDCGLYAECQPDCEHNPKTNVRKCGTCYWRDSNRVCQWPWFRTAPPWVTRQTPPYEPKPPQMRADQGKDCAAWKRNA